MTKLVVKEAASRLNPPAFHNYLYLTFTIIDYVSIEFYLYFSSNLIQ